MTDWHRIPRARRILAEIERHPPKRVIRSKVFALTRDEWVEYEGPLVDKLIAIRDEYGERALRRADVTGDYSHITRWAATGTVHEVIEDLLVDGSLQRAANLTRAQEAGGRATISRIAA